MVQIYNKIAKLGRNHGIGMMMTSTRPQDISKKSLNLTQLMFAFQMTGTSERKAMEDWFTYAGVDVKLADRLPKLEVEEPWFMLPRVMKMQKQVYILPKITFDSSKTPEFEEEMDVVELEPIDMTQLEEQMGALIENEKANDPVKLRQALGKAEIKIYQLEKELKERPVQEKSEPIKVPVPVISDEQYHAIMLAIVTAGEQVATLIEQDDILLSTVREFQEAKENNLNKLLEVIGAPKALLEQIRESLAKSQYYPVKDVITYQQRHTKVHQTGDVLRGEVMQNAVAKGTAVISSHFIDKPAAGLTGPEQRILNALAWYKTIGQTQPLKIAVAILAGYVPGAGGFTTPSSHLSAMGFVQGSTRMSLTDEGRIRAQRATFPLTQGAMRSQLMSVLKSKGPQRRIMQPLLEAWPEMINKKELAEAAGYVPGASGFTTPMSWLNKRKLTESVNGEVKAPDFLFLQA